MPLELAETRPIFLSREMLFQESAKLNTDETIWMAGTEYFGETAVQPLDHITFNTLRKSHNHTLSRTIYNHA